MRHLQSFQINNNKYFVVYFFSEGPGNVTMAFFTPRAKENTSVSSWKNNMI